jgi:hypothetical protein
VKCPACNNTQKAKEGLRCTKCRYAFIFDPKSDGMNDYRWTQLVKKASANETVCFTRQQLHTQWAMKKAPGRGGRIALGVVATAVTGIVVVAGAPALLLLAPLAVFATAIRAPKLDWDEPGFRKHFNTWFDKGGQMKGLLQKPALHEPPPAWKEPDIYDYGVERVIVVQHDLYVDLLVKNQFHLENRALVVSASGYPRYLEPQVKKALADRPDLPVLVLRDATAAGDRVASALERTLRRKVVDVGITSVDVKASPVLRRLAVDDEVPLDVLPWKAFTVAIGPAIQRATALSTLSDSSDTGSVLFVGGDNDFG